MIGLKLQFPHGFCWETVLAMIECLHADFFSQKIQTKHPFIAIVKNSDLKMPSDGWAHEANRWTHQGLLGVGGIRMNAMWRDEIQVTSRSCFFTNSSKTTG